MTPADPRLSDLVKAGVIRRTLFLPHTVETRAVTEEALYFINIQSYKRAFVKLETKHRGVPVKSKT